MQQKIYICAKTSFESQFLIRQLSERLKQIESELKRQDYKNAKLEQEKEEISEALEKER